MRREANNKRIFIFSWIWRFVHFFFLGVSVYIDLLCSTTNPVKKSRSACNGNNITVLRACRTSPSVSVRGHIPYHHAVATTVAPVAWHGRRRNQAIYCHRRFFWARFPVKPQRVLIGSEGSLGLGSYWLDRQEGSRALPYAV